MSGRRLADGARDYALAGFVLALVAAFALLAPGFWTGRNWSGMLASQVVAACVAFGVLLPLIAGEYDLSVGYLLGFLTMLGAYLGGHGVALVPIVAAMLGCGLAFGLVNGLLTVRLRINSFISTLGTGILLSGVTLGLSGGAILFQGIPDRLTSFAGSKALGLTPGVFLAVVLAAALLYLLEHTPTGSRMYATGAAPRVARLAGIRTHLLKIAAFAGGSLLVAVGAVVQLGQAGSASPGFGPELLLPAYAAAFLGATAHRPGRFNVVGTFVAILLLAIGFDGLSLLGVPAWAQPVFNGVVLLIALLVSRTSGRSIQVG